MARKLLPVVVATALCLYAIVAVAAQMTQLAAQMAQPPAQRFDIFTVKPNKSATNSMGIHWHNNVFDATNVTLQFMLQIAYDIRPALIVGLPKWAEADHWDVQGKISDYDPAQSNDPDREQTRIMLRDLLSNAFHVQQHHETKEQPVYELVIARGGVKMTKNTLKPDDPEAKKKLGNMMVNNGKIVATGVEAKNIAEVLRNLVERNVIDKTGLTDRYDITLRWAPERAGAAKPEDEDLPDLFAALQEQLGLKLQPARAPVESLVVDAVQLPESN